MKNYDHLCAPLKLAGATLKNRMLSAPTSLAELGEGEKYSPANIAYYKLKAAGGCSLVTVGDAIVDLDTGRSHPQQVGINDPASTPYLVELADAIHSGGALASIELDHGGALCSPEFIGGRNALGPSAFTDAWGDDIDEMPEADILRIADAFAAGAATAKKCGFDMVMIHAGHGWLLHQFISPSCNKRTDRWGGSLENRMRFTLLVVEKIRAAVGPAFPIDIRISGAERSPGGYDIDTGIEIAKLLDGKVDLIHVSAGTQEDEYSAVLMHPGIFQSHGENSALAAEIKKHVSTPVCAVGAFSKPDLMESFLAGSGADCIAMGRALIADPFFPKKVLHGYTNEITPCIRCGECQSHMIAKRVMRCTVNPLVGRESEYFHPILRLCAPKKVLVVGGGPAGMQAALEADRAGHQVMLCEGQNRLGGALRFADHGAFKSLMKDYRESQIRKVHGSGVDLRLNTQVDRDFVERHRPDALIIALGSEPWAPPIPTGEGVRVFMGSDLTMAEPFGESVAVIGGGLVGCEEALELAQLGKNVTILEMRPELAPDCGRMHRINLLHQLAEQSRITAVTGARCTRISKDGVHAVGADGHETLYACDSVVMATGMRPRQAEVEALRGIVPDTYVIGDAHLARNVMMAVRDARDAVVNLGLMY
ncbi:MAG: NAD(P)/FAD-dependent oxidoreductase [Lachnospiraceae bacterium]|jgi:2,4-dienoyl-CoA reductase-like NADH-dependent reductase (Old Yellow Enzyme family)/thioredoxin reductase|nr:NAD(P)/FAD-dependent oxidoreductase [Lachnospiraceae bacterium]